MTICVVNVVNATQTGCVVDGFATRVAWPSSFHSCYCETQQLPDQEQETHDIQRHNLAVACSSMISFAVFSAQAMLGPTSCCNFWNSSLHLTVCRETGCIQLQSQPGLWNNTRCETQALPGCGRRLYIKDKKKCNLYFEDCNFLACLWIDVL